MLFERGLVAPDAFQIAQRDNAAIRAGQVDALVAIGRADRSAVHQQVGMAKNPSLLANVRVTHGAGHLRVADLHAEELVLDVLLPTHQRIVGTGKALGKLAGSGGKLRQVSMDGFLIMQAMPLGQPNAGHT